MDDYGSIDALTDAALDRDLEAALAVDPSPEFAARVRTRVQGERDASWSPWRWGVAAAAGAVVVIVAVVVGTSRPNRLSQIARDAPVAQNVSAARGVSPELNAPVAQDLGPAQKRAAPARRNASRNEPEVIISAGEARALRRLFADVRKGLIDLSSLQEGPPATAALQPPGEIAFPPITFEPIATATAESNEEGERQ
jgi:hypothetical protein